MNSQLRTLLQRSKDLDLHHQELYLALLLKLDQQEKENHFLITINWDPTHPVESLQPILNKVISKKWIVRYMLTHEQRGEDESEIGKGYHNHILVERVDKKLSEVHREVFNTVKNYVGHKKHVDVQQVKPEWLQDKRDYVLGLKFDSSKQDKLEIDKLFRSTYRLAEPTTHHT